MPDKITEGSRVDVYFENVPCEFDVDVLYIPCATGDSWILKRRDGTIVYVNSFAKMIRCRWKNEDVHRIVIG